MLIYAGIFALKVFLHSTNYLRLNVFHSLHLNVMDAFRCNVFSFYEKLCSVCRNKTIKLKKKKSISRSKHKVFTDSDTTNNNSQVFRLL